MCALHVSFGFNDHARAIEIMDRIFQKSGDGTHRLVLSVDGIGGNTVRILRFAQDNETFEASEDEGFEFSELLAVAATGAHGAGLIMRSRNAGKEQVCGWRFKEGIPISLSASQTHFFHTHDLTTGEPLPPGPDVEFVDAPSLLR
ncbi:hypothetical protein [Streptomyces sp. NPDC050600]|uniref:hypothetical protein n=1 Tax=Streptomyces sp. NPDC050600 TaxID=3157213 RepID=UPI00341844B9